MDVRCEKCQTEYELDESRLKPGGVTVKCTNCGHMFKIRKRTPTNVGLPAVPSEPRQRPVSSKPPIVAENRGDPATQRVSPQRADSVLGEVPVGVNDQGSGPTGERQWLVRLENGEQKTCRELATLQQWIVAGVVGRESLISRSGKTWKRLGDISELHQYFMIAEEARGKRSSKPTPKPALASTMLGMTGGPKATAAGGTILPDDDDDRRSTGNFRSRPRTTPPPPPKSSGSSGSQPKANPLAQTELSPSGPIRAQVSTPPPIPPGRQTAAWASGDIKASESMAAMPQGPRGGKLSMQGDEPAFAGRVRIEPGSESSFQTGKVSRIDDDDDDMMAPQRGSRAGTWIALIVLLVIAGGAGAVYMLVFNKKDKVAQAPKDAAVVAVVADAAVPVAVVDAAPVAPPDPLDSARTELMAGIEPRIKGVYDSLADKTDGPSLAMRARLGTALAQSALDRSGLATDKAESDKLRKESKQLVIDVASFAQRALKAAADDPSANLAMADVLRLQSKPAKDVQRYLDLAKAKGAADKELARSIALGEAQLLARDAKLDDAQKELAALDGAGDNRVALALAMVAYAQNKPADAKPFVDTILAATPDHDVARALQKRLDTMVTKTDPLPPEGSGSVHHDPNPNGGGGGTDYDSLVIKAGKVAETNCTKAMEIYSKALEQKVTGVEALTGMGYCFLDAKQYASAFSKFRSALAVSTKYEPALAGVAETYQQQGNKEQAIEAWRKYLDAYPNTQKAIKQLDSLGAGANSGGGSGSAAPTPTPTPTPTPPAAGSGSAS